MVEALIEASGPKGPEPLNSLRSVVELFIPAQRSDIGLADGWERIEKGATDSAIVD